MVQRKGIFRVAKSDQYKLNHIFISASVAFNLLQQLHAIIHFSDLCVNHVE